MEDRSHIRLLMEMQCEDYWVMSTPVKLRHLAEFIRQLPPGNLQMEIFECGTQACVLGWAHRLGMVDDYRIEYNPDYRESNPDARIAFPEMTKLERSSCFGLHVGVGCTSEETHRIVVERLLVVANSIEARMAEESST